MQHRKKGVKWSNIAESTRHLRLVCGLSVLSWKCRSRKANVDSLSCSVGNETKHFEPPGQSKVAYEVHPEPRISSNGCLVSCSLHLFWRLCIEERHYPWWTQSHCRRNETTGDENTKRIQFFAVVNGLWNCELWRQICRHSQAYKQGRKNEAAFEICSRDVKVYV